MIGLDSCAIIDLVERSDLFFTYDSEFAFSNIVYAETAGYAHDKNLKKIDDLWKVSEKILFDSSASSKAVILQQTAREKGNELAFTDCLIAASYLSAGITRILTRNAKDFEGIDGLEVVSY